MSRANTSILWEFFQKIDNSDKKAKCCTCAEVYSYKASTANLKTHLKRKHLDAFERVSSVQSSSRKPAPIAIEQLGVNRVTEQSVEIPSTSTSSQIAEALGAASVPTSSNINQPRPTQQRIDRYGTTKKISEETKRRINSDLLDLFIDSYQPFSIVEERAFKKFVRWIPGYELPSRKTVSNVLIPNLYQKTLEKNKQELSDVEYICLTTDLWTSRVNDAYIAITGHYITQNLELKTFLLKCAEFHGTHTSANIQAALLETTEEWNLTNKVNFVISDNAANVKKAIVDLGWKHYGCYGHTLNLIVQDSLRLVQDNLDKVKAIVRHFKTSTTALERLLKAQANEKPNEIPKRVIQDVPTRWNSTFLMLERFVELESYIRATVAILKKDLPIITNEEWIMFGELCKVLKPFYEATKAMSGENYITASTIIVMTRCLKGSCDQLMCESFMESTNSVLHKLYSGLETRFDGVERSGTFTVCTFLDPRYKMSVFSDVNEATRTKKKVEELVAALINKSQLTDVHTRAAEPVVRDKFSPWSILDTIVGTQQQATGSPLSRAIREVDAYVKDETLPVFDHTGKFNSPMEWWKLNRHIYPNLAVLFRRYGNIVATSVPCERIFSKTGLTINDRRTRLTTKKVAQLTYLNVNLDPNRFKFN